MVVSGELGRLADCHEALQDSALAPFEALVQLGLEAHGACVARVEFGAKRCQRFAPAPPGQHPVLGPRGATAHEGGEHARGGFVGVGQFNQKLAGIGAQLRESEERLRAVEMWAPTTI